jgi:hypothetical protein
MTRRRKREGSWATVAGLVAVAALATTLSAFQGATSGEMPYTSTEPPPNAGWGYHGASSRQGYAPDQPLKFVHRPHVQRLGLNCLYCHYSANKSPDPGMPAVGTCMGCHTVIGPQLPARDGHGAYKSQPLTTLVAYWNKKQPVPWVRIHKVPEYVHFPHMRHVNANVTCQTCHGQIQQQQAQPVYQYASLNMGWCINCHLERKARYDCSSCHY